MNKDIQTLIEREANDHKDQTDYIASQEYICGCSNENDKLFCWDASTACSIQARESFLAGASFALSLFKWRKVGEGLPEDNSRVLIKSKAGRIYLSCYTKQSGFSSNANIAEWMPIPNIGD